MSRAKFVATFAFTFCLLAAGATEGWADWPDNAFPVKTHDFGTVAVAAKTEFRFPVHNPYSKPMHLRTVRRSCGCTTPIIETEYIQPGQTGSILARFNTDTFRGTKGATLTVVVDEPFYSEVRLRVDGYIRSDMVFHPGSIDFGSVSQGESASKTSSIMYAGRSDWKIMDVRSNVPWLVPTSKLVSRTNSRINYEITVAVREDAPTGAFRDEIIVVTNDNKRPNVPLKVSGNIESPLSISPQAIAFGSVKPGEQITKRLVVKGNSDFTIASITCEGWDVSFPESAVAKRVHLIEATFTATDANGPTKSTVEITTGGEQSVTAKAVLTADVREQ
ncbi:DUF1573 domain-containing protein [Rhodopirellula sp. MGV]|uniref:DUF1573 domain-containing protein n=1 Tax=Rhodopirellula sp. MGV TaxID=2023130 RepID=UPI000B96F4E1|nr:DUF1573 domain-containing protein [Rhodopirellula sp. MGV]OYP34451.1 hypothetical protein CGZ80_15525 [Rhodopirellula sp. MGV]PNY37374.1 DUF1573 domain-containing protein [Rhodopirellula baltica]